MFGIDVVEYNCIYETFSIPHGARLQLLLTMRGGPIHASRSKYMTENHFQRLLVVGYYNVVYLEDSFCHELDSRYCNRLDIVAM